MVNKEIEQMEKKLDDLKKDKMINDKAKSKNMYSKLIVFLVILLNSLFALGVLAVFWHTGSEPSFLITAWFAFTTGELWIMADIKKKKIKAISTIEDKTIINEDE